MEIIFIVLVLLLLVWDIKRMYKKVSNTTDCVWPKRYDERLDEITQEDRGNQSERDLISALLDYGISPKAIFHDLYVKKGKEDFSQIDVVVATRVGLIVFEVKDYSGWIFGKGHQHQWTQITQYGRNKYKFYNPILQNASHIKVLQKQSKQFKSLPFYSVVVFDGDCELKDITYIPRDTFVTKACRIEEVLDIIFEKQDACYTNKQEVINILKAAVHNGDNIEIQDKHVEQIRDKLGVDRIFD